MNECHYSEENSTKMLHTCSLTICLQFIVHIIKTLFSSRIQRLRAVHTETVAKSYSNSKHTTLNPSIHWCFYKTKCIYTELWHNAIRAQHINCYAALWAHKSACRYACSESLMWSRVNNSAVCLCTAVDWEVVSPIRVILLYLSLISINRWTLYYSNISFHIC